MINEFQALLDQHDRSSSPLRGALAPPVAEGTVAEVEAAIDAEVPRTVLELYALADGTGDQRYELFPGGPYFLPLREMATTATRLRGIAQDLLSADPHGAHQWLWRGGWRLDWSTWGDEVLAVDVDHDPGRLWYVHWEDRQASPLAVGVDAFIQACADWMAAVEPTWRDDGTVDMDVEVADRLGFPGR